MTRHLPLLLLICLSSLGWTEPAAGFRWGIGPDVCYRDYEELLLYAEKSNEQGVIYGIQSSVDSVRPCTTYYGMDVFCGYGHVNYLGAILNQNSAEVTSYTGKTSSVFKRVEGRLGWTFGLTERCWLTPFVGLGFFFWERGQVAHIPSDYAEYHRWLYGSFGLRAEVWTDCWGFELQAKAMPMHEGKMRTSFMDIEFNLGNKWHYEVAAPITYLTERYFWTFDGIRFTPYWRRQDVGQSDLQGIWYEPASQSWTAGLRLEAFALL